MVIKEFQGEYRWLSNFWLCDNGVVYEGYAYSSVEHAYQASKTLVLEERRVFQNSNITPGQAKRAGRKVTIREDWNEVKLKIMGNLVHQKFTDLDLAKKLIATGDVKLVEGNKWGDKFWGVCNGEGENNLGKILMNVREWIKVRKK